MYVFSDHPYRLEESYTPASGHHSTQPLQLYPSIFGNECARSLVNIAYQVAAIMFVSLSFNNIRKKLLAGWFLMTSPTHRLAFQVRPENLSMSFSLCFLT
jgi:hypothetical protein